MSFAKAAKRLLCLLILLFLAFHYMLAADIGTDLVTAPPAANVSVTFSAGGGKPVPVKQTLEKGTRLSTTPILTRTGYSFSGWFYDSKFTQPFSIVTPIDANTKLYAKWSRLPVVTFNTKGGKLPSGQSKQTVLVGETVSVPDVPVRTGYIFLGWYKDARLTQEFDFSTPVMSNTTIYAKWAAIPVVSFSGGGGKPSAVRVTVDFGDTVSPPDSITREGYTFDGWYTSKKYKVKFDFNTKIESKTNLYAKWIRNPVVKFSTKGKCPAPKPQTIMPEENAAEPVLNVPAGYMLEGWYADSTCRREFDFGEPIITSLTVYANIQRDPGVPLTSSK